MPPDGVEKLIFGGMAAHTIACMTGTSKEAEMMATRGHILKYLAAALLAAFCLAFARTDTTQKSMVRAVLLEPGEGGWTVGLLYQAPEASADSSEASDGIGFAAASGPDLERALDNAASLLPLDANFRLCDYLLLMPGGSWQTLSDYESLVLARQCGRTSAQLAACTFTCQELSEATEEGNDLLTSLLQTLKRSKRALPRLYEIQTSAGLLLPCVTMEEDTLPIQPEGWFVSAAASEQWDAQKTAVYELLTGQGETFTFWLGKHPLTLRRPLLSIQMEQDGSFAVHLDCQTASDSARPDSAELARLGTLCTRLIQERWEEGQDLMGLGACAALRDGEQAYLTPAKNACPQLRTDVSVY